MSSRGKAHRRSLKECLKSVLQRRRVDHDDLIVGSGILKRSNSSFALLPDFGSLSSLPDFDSSRFDIDRYSVSIPSRPDSALTRIRAVNYSQQTIVPYRAQSSLSQHDINDAYQFQSDLGQLAKYCSDDLYSNFSQQSLDVDIISQRSLLPKTSLSQLVGTDPILFQSPLSQLAHACNVPSIYQHGASMQASLVTLDSNIRSSSTLRLQRSTQSLKPIEETALAPLPSRRISASPQSDLISHPYAEKRRLPRRRSSRNLLPETSNATPKSGRHAQKASDLESGLSSIDHFSSFCVLDAAQPGCPVTAVSEDLRYVFEIGEEFCLNTAGVEGADMDTVTGQDMEGNTIIHLVVYSPLVNPSSGRSRFVLASLLDITSFITETASIPDLETISEESVIEEELKTPPRIQIQHSPRYELSSEHLLGGCFMSNDNIITPMQPYKDDIWLDIASEETKRSRSIKSTPSTPRSSSTSSSHSMDDVLDQFLASLQVLYSEFFLLGRSPLDEYSYEICNVSPKVHASREYVEGHLSKTSPEDRVYLENKLTKERAFRMRIRWGMAGELKQLYCIPLFGRSNVTWVCFLVEEDKWAGLPLWD